MDNPIGQRGAIDPCEWIVDARVNSRPAVYIGRVVATRAEIESALGPYIEICGNGVVVWGRPNGR